MTLCKAEVGNHNQRHLESNTVFAAIAPGGSSDDDNGYPPLRRRRKPASRLRLRTFISSSPCSSLTSLSSSDVDGSAESGDDWKHRNQEASQYIAAVAAEHKHRRQAAGAGSPRVTRRYRVKRPIMPISPYLSRTKLGMSPQTRLDRCSGSTGYQLYKGTQNCALSEPAAVRKNAGSHTGSDNIVFDTNQNLNQAPGVRQPQRKSSADSNCLRTFKDSLVCESDDALEPPLNRYKRPRRLVVSDSDSDEMPHGKIKLHEVGAVICADDHFKPNAAETLVPISPEPDVPLQHATDSRGELHAAPPPKTKLSDLIRRAKSGWDMAKKPVASVARKRKVAFAGRNGNLVPSSRGINPTGSRVLMPVQPAVGIPLTRMFAIAKPHVRDVRPQPPTEHVMQRERRRLLLQPSKHCDDVFLANAPAPVTSGRASDIRLIRGVDRPSMSYDAFFD